MALPDVSQQFVGDSRTFLTQDYLPKIERCVSQLTPEQIWSRANDASNSIGNLLLHLAGNVRQYLVAGLTHAPDTRDRPKEFLERNRVAKAELLQRLVRIAEDIAHNVASQEITFDVLP